MNEAPQSTQAYYQLLRVKADDKAHIKHTSDSLILTVAQYYRQHPSSGRLPEAYYYVGRVNSELLNGEKALLYFQKALLEDSLHVSTHLKSRIYAQMGYIYQRNGLYDESISLQQLAHYYCQETGDTLGMRCCTENIQAIQAAQQDSLHTPTPNQSEMMLRLQKLNTQVKNQILNSKNTKLERENAIERTLIWIATAALILLALTMLSSTEWRRSKTLIGLLILGSLTPCTQAAPQPESAKAYTQGISHMRNNDPAKAREAFSQALLDEDTTLRRYREIVDEEERVALLDGRRVELTAQEMALLLALMEKPDTPVSREQLLRKAWGYQGIGETRTVDVHIQRLRRKLGASCIETVYKLGYRLKMA